jgi:hypothetical protein
MSPFRRYAAIHIPALLLGWGVALFALHGTVQTGALVGVGIGTLSGLFSVAVLSQTLSRSFQATLAAVVTGMLLRLVLVAGALVMTHKLGGELLATAGAFFALYFIGQLAEILAVLEQQRAVRAGKEQRV